MFQHLFVGLCYMNQNVLRNKYKKKVGLRDSEKSITRKFNKLESANQTWELLWFYLLFLNGETFFLPEKWSPKLGVIFKLGITTSCGSSYFFCRIWSFFGLVWTWVCIWCVWNTVFLKPAVSFPENVHNAFPCWVPMALVRKNNKAAKSAVSFQCVEESVRLL